MTYAPEQFGPYCLLRRLRVGQLAEVFLAARGEARVVLKRALPTTAENPALREVFLAEGALAVRLHHPHIVRATLRGEHFGLPFLEFEYVHGVDGARLRDAAVGGGLRVPPRLLAHVGLGVARALAYAHELPDERGRPLGLVHRDVSPQNVLFGYDGTVRLADFGCVRLTRPGRAPTGAGVVKGKLGYLAPEQLGGGPLDARTDLFQLGLVLYELLAGCRAFPFPDIASLSDALANRYWPDTAPLRDERAAPLGAVVARLMAACPDERFPTAGALADALLAAEPGLAADASAAAAWLQTAFPDVADAAGPRAPNAECPPPSGASPAPAEAGTAATGTAADAQGTRLIELAGRDPRQVVRELGRASPRPDRRSASAPSPRAGSPSAWPGAGLWLIFAVLLALFVALLLWAPAWCA